MADAAFVGPRRPGQPRIERFDLTRHDPDGFECGKSEFDAYIRHSVRTDERDRTTACSVLVDHAERNARRRVLGYFTLNTFSLAKRQARRRDCDRSLGRSDPVPAALVGRLALDVSAQGLGLGSILLIEAIDRVLELSHVVGVAVVVVHALDDEAASFYEHQGFTRFRDEPRHLYSPLASSAGAIASQG